MAVTARSTETLNEFSQAFPETALILSLDVTDPEAVRQAVLPGMRARRSGAIINISSTAALGTSPGSGYYAATKSALESLPDGLREEYAQWREFSRRLDFT